MGLVIAGGVILVAGSAAFYFRKEIGAMFIPPRNPPDKP